MSFEDKLQKIITRHEASALRETEKEVRALGVFVFGVLDQVRGWPELSKADKKQLGAILHYAKANARTADAARFVNENVLEATNGRVHDMRLTGDLRATQDRILEAFNANEVPRRGFVYVAWKKSPEEFWYVGKASNSKRLNLSRHGKLARASASATILSLVFPNKSDTIGPLEASLIELVTAHTGRPPILNSRPEKVPLREAREDLDGVAEFLENVARDLRKTK